MVGVQFCLLFNLVFVRTKSEIVEFATQRYANGVNYIDVA